MAKNPLPLLVSLVVLAAAGYWSSRTIVPIFKKDLSVASKSTPSIERSQVEKELRWFLEIYKAEHGSYPSEISNLETAGIVPHTFMSKVGQQAFRYYLTPDGNRFTLL
jgi:hypothetical protein